MPVAGIDIIEIIIITVVFQNINEHERDVSKDHDTFEIYLIMKDVTHPRNKPTLAPFLWVVHN